MKRSKRYQTISDKLDPATLNDLREGIRLVKENASAKFDETVEMVARLGVDPRHADQQVRGFVVLPHGTGIKLSTQGYQQLQMLQDSVIVCNPHYGIRLKHERNLADFYRDLGNFFKRHCTGAEAYVYFGERELLKSIGLRPTWKKALRNGGLDGRLAKFDLY